MKYTRKTAKEAILSFYKDGGLPGIIFHGPNDKVCMYTMHYPDGRVGHCAIGVLMNAYCRPEIILEHNDSSVDYMMDKEPEFLAMFDESWSHYDKDDNYWRVSLEARQFRNDLCALQEVHDAFSKSNMTLDEIRLELIEELEKFFEENEW